MIQQYQYYNKLGDNLRHQISGLEYEKSKQKEVLNDLSEQLQAIRSLEKEVGINLKKQRECEEAEFSTINQLDFQWNEMQSQKRFEDTQHMANEQMQYLLFLTLVNVQEIGQKYCDIGRAINLIAEKHEMEKLPLERLKQSILEIDIENGKMWCADGGLFPYELENLDFGPLGCRDETMKARVLDVVQKENSAFANLGSLFNLVLGDFGQVRA